MLVRPPSDPENYHQPKWRRRGKKKMPKPVNLGYVKVTRSPSDPENYHHLT
jgi:hypothetical protein